MAVASFGSPAPAHHVHKRPNPPVPSKSPQNRARKVRSKDALPLLSAVLGLKSRRKRPDFGRIFAAASLCSTSVLSLPRRVGIAHLLRPDATTRRERKAVGDAHPTSFPWHGWAFLDTVSHDRDPRFSTANEWAGRGVSRNVSLCLTWPARRGCDGERAHRTGRKGSKNARPGLDWTTRRSAETLAILLFPARLQRFPRSLYFPLRIARQPCSCPPLSTPNPTESQPCRS
jgi:hypothetical protein